MIRGDASRKSTLQKITYYSSGCIEKGYWCNTLPECQIAMKNQVHLGKYTVTYEKMYVLG